MIKKTWQVLLLIFFFANQHSWAEDFRSGSWRFELQTDLATIPFIVELKLNGKKVAGTLYNGKETIKLENIIYSQNKLRIPLQTYEITLELNQESPTRLKGLWIRHNKSPKTELTVTGTFGITERFPGDKKGPKVNLTGKWSVELLDDIGGKTPGVAIFDQKGNYFTGSVLTPTGDYRYLEGYVEGDEFTAASFDGVFNYVLKGKIVGDLLNAALLSNYAVTILGKRDENAQLPDAYKATQLESALTFSFPDSKGKMISLTDEKFQNRPVIVQLFGSWCPNCMDEMNYFIPWYNENKAKGVEIVALAFERSLSIADAKRQLIKVQKKKNVPYPLLLAGTTAADKPMDKIKGLKNFISFPTLIFLNKKHEVVKIHAGFTGPGTGEFFEKWKNEFNETINELIK